MTASPLAGCRVLIPRGGELGERLCSRVRKLGGSALVAPLIAFAPPADAVPLERAMARLAEGCYDWIVVTSATTVDAIAPALAAVPSDTRVAAVGPATAAALRHRGVEVDLLPDDDHSAMGLLSAWPSGDGAVLLPQSEIAAPTLATGLRERGLAVDAVTAYRTLRVPLAEHVRQEVRSGGIDAVLLTSGSTARHLAADCAPLPETTAIVCIGASTATAAHAAGLAVSAVAARSDGESLIDALVGLMS